MAQNGRNLNTLQNRLRSKCVCNVSARNWCDKSVCQNNL